MPPYYLRKNTFCCLANGHLVFLDLETDKYLCLDQEKSRICPDLWTDKPHQNQGDPMDDALNTIAQALLEQRLITQNQDKSAAPCPPTLPKASETLLTLNSPSKADITFGHFLSFLKAAFVATYRLRFQSLKQVVTHVNERRTKHEKLLHPYNNEKARILVNSFTMLRPLLPSRGQCLFNALALIEYLASYDIFPNWVFGVRMAPFIAHCWVQNKDVVFNEPLDHIASLTPIMVV